MKRNLSVSEVVLALENLKKRKVDLNPYSVADELQAEPDSVFGDGDLMELISIARGELNGIQAAEYNKLLRRIEELEEMNATLLSQNEKSEQEDKSARLERFEIEAIMLRESKLVLLEQLSEAENAREFLSKKLEESEAELVKKEADIQFMLTQLQSAEDERSHQFCPDSELKSLELIEQIEELQSHNERLLNQVKALESANQILGIVMAEASTKQQSPQLGPSSL